MRQLLEQQEKRKEQLKTARKPTSDNSLLSVADETFLRKVLQYIEQNLDNPEYSVEVLSRDMGMDRTGLYRRLISVVGKTPTNFIRSIRLKRAAQLLKEGYTVAEVADLVGFNTSSYLSKCFQEEFGMRPSQYINQWKTDKPPCFSTRVLLSATFVITFQIVQPTFAVLFKHKNKVS